MKRLSHKRKHKDNLLAYLFLLPCLVGFVMFIGIPVLSSLFFTFTDWNLIAGLDSMKFVAFDNFKHLLSGKDLWFNASFKNTLLFALVTVPVGTILGLIVATAIHKYVYFSSAFRFVIFIPYISSVVASVVVWQVIFQPAYGPVNSFLMSIGLMDPPKWFVDTNWAIWIIMVFQIWQTMGYNVIVFYAGLKGISEDLYDAATVDGAGELQKFRHVTIPMISPTTFFLSTLGLISAFKVFDVVKVATNGGPGKSSMVLALYIYREAFENNRMGTASAAVWLMFLIVFVITMVQMYGQRKWVTYE